MIRHFVALLIVSTPFTGQAQHWVTATAPAANAVGGEFSNVVLAFSESIDSASVSNEGIVIFGDQRGSYPVASAVVAPGGMEVVLTPADPFFPGERISVIVTTTLRNTGGDTMPSPFLLSYVADVPEGSQEFTVSATVPIAGSTPYGIVCADLDRDGDLDLAVANRGGASVVLLSNDGDGTFAPAGTIPVGNNPEAIDAGDLDNDGDIDLVIANSASNTASVLINEGSLVFTSLTSLSTGASPHTVNIGDLDGDGNQDVLVS
ncbi:MAG: FG-GAP-like repeat-containing protein, partial [Ignavibacteria bacterium]|nr:FG-GAP-like repeat-containing protein [Ignavibacteria bacterium]